MQIKTGPILVLAAGLSWSFQGLMIKQIEVAGPAMVLCLRSAAMVPVVFAFLAWRTGGRPLAAIRSAGAAGVVGALGLLAAMGLAILAFKTTTVANAAFLFAASPFIAALLGRLVLHERVASATVLAIILAAAGIFVMVGDGLRAGDWLGNAAALGSACGFAIFTVALRWRHLDDNLPPSVLGGAFGVIAGGLAAASLGEPTSLPPMDIVWCVLMGAFTLTGGTIFYTLGSRSVPAAELTLLSNVEVILAPLWAWLLIGEAASAATLAGGAIVVAALVVQALAGQARAAVT